MGCQRPSSPTSAASVARNHLGDLDREVLRDVKPMQYVPCQTVRVMHDDAHSLDTLRTYMCTSQPRAKSRLTCTNDSLLGAAAAASAAPPPMGPLYLCSGSSGALSLASGMASYLFSTRAELPPLELSPLPVPPPLP